MKKLLFAILILFSISCKKESAVSLTPDPGNPNNKVEADVLVHGTNIHVLSVGNGTTLEKQDYNFTTRYVDSVLIIHGLVLLVNGDFDKEIEIFLTNIKDPGTYVFGQLDSGQNIEVLYEEASTCSVDTICLGPTYLANSDQNAGELIIESISDKHLKGTFKTSCFPVYYTDSTDIAEITHASFSGDF